MNYIERKVISFLDKQEWKSVIKSYKKEAKKKDSLSGGKKLIFKRNNEKNNEGDIMNDYVIKYDELSAYEYMELWNSVWDDAPSLEQVDLAMKNTLFRVSIFDKDRLIGMARVIGDKGLSYYIKDVVVIPEYQGKGIGRILINELLKYVNDNGIKNTDIYVELCAMPKVAEFYEKCGFYSDEGIRLKMWYEVK